MAEKIILKVGNLDNASIALRAAKQLIQDGYDDCIYVYGNKPNEYSCYAKKNKASVTVSDTAFYE